MLLDLSHVYANMDIVIIKIPIRNARMWMNAVQRLISAVHMHTALIQWDLTTAHAEQVSLVMVKTAKKCWSAMIQRYV